jgi:cell division protein FtsB
LQENNIDCFDELKIKASSASGVFATVTKQIREIESRQKEISELQRYIGQYSKTRNIYAKYKASGWSREIYDKHATDIILHRAAKKHFNEIGKKKLPSIAQLKQEYAKLSTERKALYSDYHRLKKTSRELVVAQANCEQILGISPERSVGKEQNTHGNNLSQTK